MNGPVVELVTMPRCQRVWMSVRVRPGPPIIIKLIYAGIAQRLV